MANEWTLLYETHTPIPMTCSNTTGIEKGALLKMSDPATVALADGANDVVGGVAAEEKIASDGKTKISVYRGGIFKAKVSGSISAGNAFITRGNANIISGAGVNNENIVGIALETATEGQTLMVELRPTVMNLA